MEKFGLTCGENFSQIQSHDIRKAASLNKSESKILIHAQPKQQLSDHFEMILERLSFQQNYNQYFVNAFIINLNKYFHFRCERGPITTLLMFTSTSKMLNHNAHPFFRISIESERNFTVSYAPSVSHNQLLSSMTSTVTNSSDLLEPVV